MYSDLSWRNFKGCLKALLQELGSDKRCQQVDGLLQQTECRDSKRSWTTENAEIRISGLVIKQLKPASDERGWLAECFRCDEISKEIYPLMSYATMTLPGHARGPHEHLEQTDYFCFLGTSTFKLHLWDNREESSTFGEKMTVRMEEGVPMIAIVPPGVVHALKNVGENEGLVLNFPNRLYAGWGRKGKVDEIRYESDYNSRFKIEA
ncbi:MAG: dTDP-4-dehydrorhamnose 3,5-epimerase family protein [Sedimentisphaerales bacterium]|nr:dTDP-4-dehydrorhamnose 3,5-epimerase family protein [Sedimentisphaerales bacterium]